MFFEISTEVQTKLKTRKWDHSSSTEIIVHPRINTLQATLQEYQEQLHDDQVLDLLKSVETFRPPTKAPPV